MLQSNRFCDALVYAATLHADQRRKLSGAPYVSHLLRVTGIVLEFGGDEDEAIAALLHDAVEDQGGASTRTDIQSRFGDRVAAIVDGCSDTDRQPKPPWRARKKAALKRLRKSDPSVRLVVAADKLDNALSLAADYRRRGPEVWNLFRGGRDGTLWYYRSVVEVLGQREPQRILDELRRAVVELERLVGGQEGEQPGC